MRPLLPDVWRHLARWRGYSYGPLSNSRRTVDCSSLAASILRDHYGRDVITPDVWRAIQVLGPDGEVARRRPWIAVETVAKAVGELPVHPHTGPHQPRPGRLHLCQGWRHLTTEGIGPGSRGHQWLWLSYGGWSGVALESSSVGPRIWDAIGPRHIDELLSPDGHLHTSLQPLDWAARAEIWTSGVAYVVLP